jgi:hypothetical protein
VALSDRSRIEMGRGLFHPRIVHSILAELGRARPMSAAEAISE